MTAMDRQANNQQTQVTRAAIGGATGAATGAATAAREPTRDATREAPRVVTSHNDPRNDSRNDSRSQRSGRTSPRTPRSTETPVRYTPFPTQAPFSMFAGGLTSDNSEQLLLYLLSAHNITASPRITAQSSNNNTPNPNKSTRSFGYVEFTSLDDLKTVVNAAREGQDKGIIQFDGLKFKVDVAQQPKPKAERNGDRDGRRGEDRRPVDRNDRNDRRDSQAAPRPAADRPRLQLAARTQPVESTNPELGGATPAEPVAVAAGGAPAPVKRERSQKKKREDGRGDGARRDKPKASQKAAPSKERVKVTDEETLRKIREKQAVQLETEQGVKEKKGKELVNGFGALGFDDSDSD